jgi:hypothetical protein
MSRACLFARTRVVDYPEGHNVLDERRIKAAVIDRLLKSGALDDAVLINEMVYANWTRRADLAVANGHLHAFEIKSDFDSLRRLEGQIAVYLERFDKLTLVVASKFLDEVLASVPSRVAVWNVFEDKSDVKISVVRAGRQEKIENHDVLIGYLLRDELYHFLTARKLVVRRTDSRTHLVTLARTQPLSSLRAYVLQALKARYQKSYCSFLAARKESTSSSDLLALRKTKDLDSSLHLRSVVPPNPHSKQLHLSLAKLFPHGEVPAELSTTIIVRNRVAKRRKLPFIS